MTRLSKPQRAVLEYMTRWTVRKIHFDMEIVAALDRSRNRVMQTLYALEKKGCITRGSLWGSWYLAWDGRDALQTETSRLASKVSNPQRKVLLSYGSVYYMHAKLQVVQPLVRAGLVELDVRARLTRKGQAVKTQLRRKA